MSHKPVEDCLIEISTIHYSFITLLLIYIYITINISISVSVNMRGIQILDNDVLFFKTFMIGLLNPLIIFIIIIFFKLINLKINDVVAIYQTAGVRVPDFLRSTFKRTGFRQTSVVVVLVGGWGYCRLEVAPTWLTTSLGKAVYSYPVEASLLVISLAWFFCWPERAIMCLVFSSLVIGELIPNNYSPQREMPASFAYFLLVWVTVRYILDPVVAGVSRCVRPLAIVNPRVTNLRPIGDDDLGNRTQVS